MMQEQEKSKAFIRLRTILLILNLTVLLLPLLGIFFFRFYENALVRQTEIELISQAAVIGSLYKQNLIDRLSGEDIKTYGLRIAPENLQRVDEYYTPVLPHIDLSKNTLYPSRPDGVFVETPLHPRYIEIAERLSWVMKDAQRTTLSGIKLLNYDGIAIAANTEVGLGFGHIPEVQKALEGKYTSLIRRRVSDEPPPALASISRGTGIRVFVAYPIIYEDHVWGVVYLSRTPQNILKHLYAEKEKVFLTTFIVLGITLLLVMLTSYAISRPIHRLVRKTSEFAAGNKNAIQPIEHPVIREVELLSESYANMARSLNDRADYIRDFAMHVSHEFKTPITSIQGSAELLREHLETMEPEKREKFLSNIIDDSDRLQRLVKRLLELARADHYNPANESHDLMEVLKLLKARYKDIGLAVDFDEHETHMISMSKDNMEAILTNLFDNAKQHGAKIVRVDIHTEDGFSRIRISDDGEGISKANKYKIFTPFFTTRRESGGTGLGLGIVSSLLQRHKGSIEILDTEKGTTFEIIIG